MASKCPPSTLQALQVPFPKYEEDQAAIKEIQASNLHEASQISTSAGSGRHLCRKGQKGIIHAGLRTVQGIQGRGDFGPLFTGPYLQSGLFLSFVQEEQVNRPLKEKLSFHSAGASHGPSS